MATAKKDEEKWIVLFSALAVLLFFGALIWGSITGEDVIESDVEVVEQVEEVVQEEDGDNISTTVVAAEKTDNTDNQNEENVEEDSLTFSINTDQGGKYVATTSLANSSEVMAYGSDGCAVEFYVNGNKADEEKTQVIVDGCDEEISSDFRWEHSGEFGSNLNVASSPVEFCQAGSANCSSGNGILEVVSKSNVNGARVVIVDSTGINEQNAKQELTPIINSITISTN